ncbi:MAG: hypothetical protein ACK6CU_27555 [Deltaproteobacteria bacterium]|jgi:hypothetical protein
MPARGRACFRPKSDPVSGPQCSPSSAAAAHALAPGAERRQVQYQAEIPSRPTVLGEEEGTLEDVAARTVRHEAELAVEHTASRFFVRVVRSPRPGEPPRG